jgi:hypothetical protein
MQEIPKSNSETRGEITEQPETKKIFAWVEQASGLLNMASPLNSVEMRVFLFDVSESLALILEVSF